MALSSTGLLPFDIVMEIVEMDGSAKKGLRVVAVETNARAFPVAHTESKWFADGQEVFAIGADSQLVLVLLAVDSNAQIDGLLLEGAQQSAFAVLLHIESSTSVLTADANAPELLACAE